jgi:hypothetical protein
MQLPHVSADSAAALPDLQKLLSEVSKSPQAAERRLVDVLGRSGGADALKVRPLSVPLGGDLRTSTSTTSFHAIPLCSRARVAH